MTKNDLRLIPGNQKLLGEKSEAKIEVKKEIPLSKDRVHFNPAPMSSSMNKTINRTIGQNTYNPKKLNKPIAATPQKAGPTERKLKLVYSKPSLALLFTALASLLSGQPTQAQSIFESTSAKSWALIQVEAEKAKKIAKTENSITVAVIDTGIDIHHSDLKYNLWVNTGETGVDSFGRDKATNGIDDDGNGYVDDLHGWNFVNRNNDLTDIIGHGTHISGIIASNKGVAGGTAKIMSLKYYNPKATSRENLENTIAAIRYAIKMKAQIINYSAGGLEKSFMEEKAILEAQAQKILFVAAAGNEKSNSDLKGFYPADYDISNILSVTAVDPNKRVLDSSNYGIKSVDIAAPGKDIYSTIPGGYGIMSGTSQATAFVSGIAALVMASQTHLKDPEEVIEHILASGERERTLIGKTKSNSLANSYRAIAMQGQGVSAFGDKADNLQSLPTSQENIFFPSKIWNAN